MNNIIFKMPENDMDKGQMRVGGHFPMTFTITGKFKYVGNSDPFVQWVFHRAASVVPHNPKVPYIAQVTQAATMQVD